ncbi:MAG: hypothetical protein MK226_11835 [Saprospiraceae bacterium]|nr:hypothetical protein [Saprospiraceae bacterium]
MARKFKTTPFARFFLMILILAPLAYVGAAYYNGEDPIQNVKQAIGLEQTIDNKDSKATKKIKGKSEVERLREENKKLKKELQEKKAEIKKLKNR